MRDASLIILTALMTFVAINMVETKPVTEPVVYERDAWLIASDLSAKRAPIEQEIDQTETIFLLIEAPAAE